MHFFQGLLIGLIVVVWRSMVAEQQDAKRYQDEDNCGVNDNVYQQWTLEHDRLLWDHHHTDSLPQLAARLGRGLGGTRERLQRLRDVNSAAYLRLFGCDTELVTRAKSESLIPARQVLRRIEWDSTLTAKDYSIRYYDRVKDDLLDMPLLAPNEAIQGPHRRLVDALPEHRIRAILYKERVVWDRESKLDIVGPAVEESYGTWVQEKEEAAQQQLERQESVRQELKEALGEDSYMSLMTLTNEFSEKSGNTKARKAVSGKLLVETFIEQALLIFRQETFSDLNDALDALSEVMALHPDAELRSAVLQEIHVQLERNKHKSNQKKLPTASPLPELNEDEIEESFIRGTGPGGQKVNKTSNRVVLVHIPTQIRVECQDTRYLPQNRKLARKRLRLKLDAHYNGSQSRTQRVAEKVSSKKQKAKARSRARLRKKQALKMENEPADED